MNIDLTKMVQEQFQPLYSDTHTYQILPAGRASGKTVYVKQRILLDMMQDGRINACVFRLNEKDHKDSTFSEFIDFIKSMGTEFESLWKINTSPYQITYRPFGNYIIFKGFNDSENIKGVKARGGYFCRLWLEEAQTIPTYEDFKNADDSFRGQLPDGLFKQWYITFNSPMITHWTRDFAEDAYTKVGLPKDMFITDKNEKYTHYTYTSLSREHGTNKNAITFYSIYKKNPFLSEKDIENFESDCVKNPRNYELKYLGEFGSANGIVYENWEIKDFEISNLLKGSTYGRLKSPYKVMGGLDFGSIDPTALVICAIDKKEKILYVWDEHYEAGLLHSQCAGMIISKGYFKTPIICENADDEAYKTLKHYGIKNLKKVHKYHGNSNSSIVEGIKKVQEYKIYIHPRCKNLIREIGAYCWGNNKYGQPTGKPAEYQEDHLLDALRYMVMYVERYGFFFGDKI
jgi:phage terminase large subunit